MLPFRKERARAGDTGAVFFAKLIAAVIVLAAIAGGGAALAIGRAPAQDAIRLPGAVTRAMRVGEAEDGSPGADSDADLPRDGAGPACERAIQPGDFIRSFEMPEGERLYRLHVPANPGARFLPMVLNFHGYGRTAAEQEEYSELAPLADREGFVLVTPEGSGSPQGWDIPGIYADIGIDDTAFAAALIRDLTATLCIDGGRVFATGMSNGAQMAALLACAYPELVAAAAPVAGLAIDPCPNRVPIIAFEGSDDWNVEPWLVEETFALWGPANGCDTEPTEERVSEHVVKRAFANCGGFDAELYWVEGGGHTWPGGAPDSVSGAGFVTDEINATELIWRFFRAVGR